MLPVFRLLFLFCLFFFVFILESIFPLENFSLIWRRHHCRWRTANFDIYSALMTIEQWGFFIVPHLVWHGSSPRTCDNLTYCRAFGSGAVTTCFLWLRSVATGDRTDVPHTRRTLYLYATAAVFSSWLLLGFLFTFVLSLL